MCSGDGIIVFLNKRILFNDGVDKKNERWKNDLDRSEK